MDAAMPGNLEEHFQVVPFRGVWIHRGGLSFNPEAYDK
jgi:hypothetical protein